METIFKEIDMQNRNSKIAFLKDVKAGKVDLKAFENPLTNIDMNNLPCSTPADFVQLKKCHDYAQDFEQMQKELFEALIKAGRNIGIVDDETEATWRSMKARGEL